MRISVRTRATINPFAFLLVRPLRLCLRNGVGAAEGLLLAQGIYGLEAISLT